MTQNERIINHLTKGRTLTVDEARSRYGVQNLSARVHELRKNGFNVLTESKTFRGGQRRGETVTAYTF